MKKNILMDVGFRIVKIIPYSILKNMIKNNGKPMTYEEYSIFKNSSTQEIIRAMGLIKESKEEMPIKNVNVRIDFTPQSCKDINLSIKEMADKNNIFVGVASDIHKNGLLDENNLLTIVKEFNSFTFENEMKWNKSLVDAKGEEIFNYDFTMTDKYVDYFQERDIRIRGHALVWSKFGGMTFPNYVQTSVQKSNDPKKELEDILYERVTGTVNHFKGKVAQWDVVNESMPYGGEFSLDGYFNEVMGEEYIIKSFEFARKADPNAQLILNEAFGATSGQKAKDYLEWIKHLLDRGMPLDAIGIQSHVTRGNYDIEGINFFAKELIKLGLNLEITEFDMSIVPFRECENPLMAQAQYTYDILSSAIKAGNLSGITFWGLSDKHCWYDEIYPFSLHKPNKSNMFDKDLQPKPMYYATKKLLQNAIDKV